MDAKRCHWCNPNNPLYIKYHDEEWGVLNLDDHYLYEMFILESFQAGLSWECILNKREAFRKAFCDFDIQKIIKFDQNDIDNLMNNQSIIRNKLKIKAVINNSKIYLTIKKEFGSFREYLLSFSKGKIFHEIGKTTNKLSDEISKDLIKRGMKFSGSITIYSYLQAIGIIDSHEKECFKYKI